MKISQISSGSAIIIEMPVAGSEEPVFIKTEAIFPMSGGLLVKPPLDGTPMNVTLPAKITIANKRDQRSYIFEAKNVAPMETDYGTKYLIMSDTEAEPLCRRKAERYDILCINPASYYFQRFKG